jgi:Rps23 Pro-64 3,4-dihydroxylase Tpa1-like proline 4-hydroxylase
MIKINISQQEYFDTNPYNNYVIDNILSDEFALELQTEIINLDKSLFDRYDNPFENKWTYHDKNNLPFNCNKLFNYLESNEFMVKLSNICGIKLIKDPTKNFWGIHMYDDKDKLDIHVDAGVHPVNKLKKELTLGIYLSKNWKYEYGGQLEIWKGTNAKLISCERKIEPKFNRLVMFTCDDNAWHGNPCPVNTINTDATRIFVTISYLSDRQIFENQRQKAYFIKLPNEQDDPEKDKLRLMRADPEKYKEIYRCK